MFKTFFKKASISFVFALILGCGCGKDNLFASEDHTTQTTMQGIQDQINEITTSNTHTNDQKCDALKNLHATHTDNTEAVKKIQSAMNTLNCSK